MITSANGNLTLLGQTTTPSEFKKIETCRTPAQALPYVYIKTICHYVVLVSLLCDEELDRNISLPQLREKSKALKDSLIITQGKQPFQDVLLSYAIGLTLRFIHQMLECHDRREIKSLKTDYLKKISASLNHAGHLATQYQLTGMNKIIWEWHNKYDLNLRSTYIILVGARGPKEGLIERQFFDKLRESNGMTKENTVSGGIIYSEMLPSQMNMTDQHLIDDLARELLNRKIGQEVLGNQNAMNQDVLGKHAPGILAKLGLWKTLEPVVEPKMRCPFHR